MKFLDLTGLTYFFNKVKTWIHLNYLSLNDGGTIQGSVSIRGESGLNINEQNEYSQRYVNISYINGISIGTHYDEGNRNEDSININQSYISAPQFKKTNGKSTQVLIADGSIKEIGAANGVAGLDANGYVPLSQLGNLDTTVAEVVTALPTTNIKKHIYLIKDTDGVTQNQYEEYIYTGDTSATYDASKWEKLGDFHATVDLANYAKKNEAVGSIEVQESANAVDFEYKDINGTRLSFFSLERASENVAGVMSSADRNKLDGIENNANNYSLPTASSTTKGGITLGYSQNDKNYPVALDDNGKAYVNIPWTDTNTTYGLATSTNDGLMSKADKTKIDSIDTIYAKKTQAANELNITPYESQVNFTLLNIEDADELSDIVLQQATSTQAGVMTASDKNKLDGIASGATADSAITTAEIDALFA